MLNVTDCYCHIFIQSHIRVSVDEAIKCNIQWFTFRHAAAEKVL